MTSRFDAKSFYLGSKFLWIPFWNPVLTSSFFFSPKKHWEFIGPCNKNSLRYSGCQKICQSQQSQPKHQIATRNHQILGFLWSCFSFKPGNSTRVLAPKLGFFFQEICWPPRIPLSADWMISNPKRPDISPKVYYVDAGINPANHLRCIKPPLNGRINSSSYHHPTTPVNQSWWHSPETPGPYSMRVCLTGLPTPQFLEKAVSCFGFRITQHTKNQQTPSQKLGRSRKQCVHFLQGDARIRSSHILLNWRASTLMSGILMPMGTFSNKKLRSLAPSLLFHFLSSVSESFWMSTWMTSEVQALQKPSRIWDPIWDSRNFLVHPGSNQPVHLPRSVHSLKPSEAENDCPGERCHFLARRAVETHTPAV